MNVKYTYKEKHFFVFIVDLRFKIGIGIQILKDEDKGVDVSAVFLSHTGVPYKMVS